MENSIRKIKKALYIIILAILSSCQATKEGNPAIPGLVKSDLYKVHVGKRMLWTEKYSGQMDPSQLDADWFSASYVRKKQEMHIAEFSSPEKENIKIHVNQVFKKVTIRPLNRGINPKVEGQDILFNWDAPGYLVIEIDTLPPLFLFRNAIEKETKAMNSDDVLFFGPGVHEPGFIQLQDHQVIYIAEGAIVYGGIRGQGVSDVKISGRGILDGKYSYARMIKLDSCRNIAIEGITIRDSKGWTNTITNCDNISYTGVKVISFGPGGDGINPLNSRSVEISGCFLRCTDDCIAIKSPHDGAKSSHIRVENNVMIGYAYSDGITIGYETNEDISDVIVRNCDILQARGGSRVDGHSGFSIICDGPGVISNVRFENINVENVENKLFELHITDGTKYGINPPGQIRDVLLKNVHWLPEGPIILKGYDQKHKVENVVFEDCRVNNKNLVEVYKDLFDFNMFTTNVTILQSGVTTMAVPPNE